jgi:DNA-binding beta-propeller fold protein YncE
MIERTITIEAHTLEEAWELVKGRVPPGLTMLEDRVDVEGTVGAVRAAAETAQAAFALALKAVPADTRVIAQEELTPAERTRMPVQAHSEEKARARVQERLHKTQVLEALELQQAGKKGVLGVGSQPSAYEAVILQQAVVEVRYQAKTTFAFTVGPQRKYRLLKMWGGYGLRKGLFYSPVGIAVDRQGNVYVTDNGLVLNEATKVADRYSHVCKFDGNGTWLGEWGEHGTGEGQFVEAQGIAVDAAGYIYVADGTARRIGKFDSRGRWVATWGEGNAEDQFSGGYLHLALAPDGSVYVSDRSAHRILHLAADGSFVGAWGSNGSGEGQFERPEGLAVDAQGCVYVADGGNDRVQKFGAEGRFIRQWGGRGLQEGQFAVPRGIAVDAAGCIYVCSAGIPLQKFTTDGEFIAQWTTQGPTSGRGRPKSERPEDVAVDPSGAVLLLEANLKHVHKFG